MTPEIQTEPRLKAQAAPRGPLQDLRAAIEGATRAEEATPDALDENGRLKAENLFLQIKTERFDVSADARGQLESLHDELEVHRRVIEKKIDTIKGADVRDSYVRRNQALKQTENNIIQALNDIGNISADMGDVGESARKGVDAGFFTGSMLATSTAVSASMAAYPAAVLFAAPLTGMAVGAGANWLAEKVGEIAEKTLGVSQRKAALVTKVLAAGGAIAAMPALALPIAFVAAISGIAGYVGRSMQARQQTQAQVRMA